MFVDALWEKMEEDLLSVLGHHPPLPTITILGWIVPD